MAGHITPGRCAEPSEYTAWVTPWGLRVECHKALLPRYKLACKRAFRFARFKPKRIDSRACRDIRGSSTLSKHALACAFDTFATKPGVPPPGGVWTPDNTYGTNFARCFTDLGFTWGKQWSREDDPHMEWSSYYVPPITLAERLRTRKLAVARSRKDKSRARSVMVGKEAA